MSTAASTTSTEALVERFGLKALVEACLVLEEGLASTKDIEVGMMAGAGIVPGPFARADERGLDEVLEALERAQSEWGEAFEPPLILRRLVAQGRLGRKTGQGFFPYPQPDENLSKESVLFERRGDVGIVWLNRPPANPLSPQVISDLGDLWKEVREEVRALVFASSNIFTFSAGADIKEFTKMKPDEEGQQMINAGHGLMRSMEQSSVATIAAVNSLALGGGCELAMACDFRIAAESATFGQPEINLGIIPGWGGTQRLARVCGLGAAKDLILTGRVVEADEALRIGLVNGVHDPVLEKVREVGALLASKSPLALTAAKRALNHALQGDHVENLEREADEFGTLFASEDAHEGMTAFAQKRAPHFTGR
jgi:enoyl-CoA hydratase / 3-hydroxyacyl-CoA dehydrogenase